MNILDIILMLCFIPSIIAGLKKGFVSQVISITAFIVGAWLSFHFAYTTGEWLSNYVQTDIEILRLVAFGLIMIVTYLIFSIIGKYIKKAIRVTMLDWLDAFLGIFLSMLKVALFIGAIIIIFDALNEREMFFNSPLMEESLLYGHIKDFTYIIFPYIEKLVVAI